MRKRTSWTIYSATSGCKMMDPVVATTTKEAVVREREVVVVVEIQWEAEAEAEVGMGIQMMEAEVVAGVEDQDQDNRMLSKTVQRQDLLPQHVLLAL